MGDTQGAQNDRHDAQGRTAQVVVVGAGPVGLLLAGDLAGPGVDVLLLEKRAEADAQLTRAFTVHARTLEQLDARGLADELIEGGERARTVELPGIGVQLSFEDLPTRFPFVLVTPQYRVEQLLERRALAAGARIQRCAEVVTLDQDAGGVRIGTADGAEYRAAYAVGTDGARSTVRRLLGLGFPGESVVSSQMLADVRLEDAPREALAGGANEHGIALVIPFGDGWYRVVAWNSAPGAQRSEDAPVDIEEIREVLLGVLGTDFGMHDPRWVSRLNSDERQAPRYRVGRVLIAGDAAHVHSPAGGQGMNTGLQDAANLGWKLAAVVRKAAPDTLLDSYERERYPVGRAAVRTSGSIIRLALAVARPGRARRLAMSLALGALNRALRLGGPVRALTRRVPMRISGLDFAYPAPGPRGRGPQRLAGRRVPDLRLADGDCPRLYEALRGGSFVLVTRGRPTFAVPAGVRVCAPAGTSRASLLVRPDGYAAWAGREPTEDVLNARYGTRS